MERLVLDDIHPDTEQVLQIELEPHEVQEAPSGLDADEKVEVASLHGVPASNRAKQPHVGSAMALRDADDLRPMGADKVRAGGRAKAQGTTLPATVQEAPP